MREAIARESANPSPASSLAAQPVAAGTGGQPAAGPPAQRQAASSASPAAVPAAASLAGPSAPPASTDRSGSAPAPPQSSAATPSV
eukprot:14170842-Alexandrium_andersonii.AAC.1